MPFCFREVLFATLDIDEKGKEEDVPKHQVVSSE
jgi:hypothetical protein